MKSIDELDQAGLGRIRYVLTDIDDTLTNEGRLPSAAFQALEALRDSKLKVVPITGRPAGWCDHMARMWPVDGIVGENGAFYFTYLSDLRKMVRRYWKTEEQRRKDRARLDKIRRRILEEIPGAAVSADQPYREADLAIDFCEDVPPLPSEAVDRIVEIFHQMGAQAKISSIHVNGWFGTYDKLGMTRIFFKEVFDENLDAIKEQVVFIGDSPNDAPMFAFFPTAVGVANIAGFANRMSAKPSWITHRQGGYGFAELAQKLIDARKGRP